MSIQDESSPFQSIKLPVEANGNGYKYETILTYSASWYLGFTITFCFSVEEKPGSASSRKEKEALKAANDDLVEVKGGGYSKK